MPFGSDNGLVVSSGAVINPCDTREPPPVLAGNIGVSVPGGYDLMTYQRLASVLYAHPSPPGHLDPATATPAPPTPPGHPLLPGQEHILHPGNLDLKDGLGGLSTAWPYTMYYPYDTLAAYPFAHGYGMTFDAARRKNATRETTATLKAWLNEHKKNPYPTKGEKIMLAIITKMTLTQVSTWFANARRRLKKENKMTWEPRNKTDDDDDDDDFKDDVSSDNERRKEIEPSSERVRDEDTELNGDERMDRSSPPCLSPPVAGVPCSTNGHSTSSPVKPRIWSLADMAASSSASSSSTPAVIGVSKLLHRPFHLETSPYIRPVPQLNPRFPSPQETLLQVYAKSLGFPPHAAAAAFPPLALNGFGGPLMPPTSSICSVGDPLPPTLIPHSLSHTALSAHSTSTSPVHLHISRPVATRPVPVSSPLFIPVQHTLPGGARITPAATSSPPSSPISPITEV